MYGMKNLLKLYISKFRAIEEADLDLKGITVVTGVNGCGKSTLSKFLYYSFKTVNEFDRIVINNLNEDLAEIRNFVFILRQEIKRVKNYNTDGNMLNDVSVRYRQVRKMTYTLADKDNILSELQSMENEYVELYKHSFGVPSSSSKRLVNILEDILSTDGSVKDFPSLMNGLYNRIEEIFYRYAMVSETRPSEMVEDELAAAFDYGDIPEHYSISEYGDAVIGNDVKHISYFHTIKNSVYIDTPMLLGADFYYKGYWDDVNRLLKKNNAGNLDTSPVSSIILSQIIKGESNYQEDDVLTDKFVFTTQTGKTYNLLDCATGVKSFSILQMLLKNGFMSGNTFLIIDEPEVHLHPQWVVEYARLIVLLNKYLGVKFLVASHNPDMVSAIKYISVKEQVSNVLNFYLAEPADSNEESYRYRNLGLDINPIFESFNIALDRINLYGVSDDEE